MSDKMPQTLNDQTQEKATRQPTTLKETNDFYAEQLEKELATSSDQSWPEPNINNIVPAVPTTELSESEESYAAIQSKVINDILSEAGINPGNLTWSVDNPDNNEAPQTLEGWLNKLRKFNETNTKNQFTIAKILEPLENHLIQIKESKKMLKSAINPKFLLQLINSQQAKAWALLLFAIMQTFQPGGGDVKSLRTGTKNMHDISHKAIRTSNQQSKKEFKPGNE